MKTHQLDNLIEYLREHTGGCTDYWTMIGNASRELDQIKAELKRLEIMDAMNFTTEEVIQILKSYDLPEDLSTLKDDKIVDIMKEAFKEKLTKN